MNDKALTMKDQYGTTEEVKDLSERVKDLLPGANLTDSEAMAAAQYARAIDANIFRREIHPVKIRGKLELVEDYKLLVRWARRRMPYTERFERLRDGDSDLLAGAIGYKCYILRDDARPLLFQLTDRGADFEVAYEIAASWAVGIVTAQERKNSQPPKTWSWDQVARKRALKNALRLSHHAPSPSEIARESWMVGDTETAPEDWQVIDPALSPGEREQLAALAAETRQRNEERGEMTPEKAQEILERNRIILHGGPDDDGDLTPPGPGPYFEAEDVEVLNKAGESVKLGDLDNEALGYIVNHPGAFSRDERESAGVILAARNGQ